MNTGKFTLSQRLLAAMRIPRPGQEPPADAARHASRIRERKLAEVLRGRLAAIVEFSNDAIISKNLTGVVTSWNAAAEKLFGYSAEEMIGQPITRLIPPEQLEEENQLLIQFGRDERVEGHETVRLHKDGRRVDISLELSPIKDAEGHVVGVSKIARDISKQKRQGEALAASELRYRRLFEAAKDGILILNAKTGMVVDVNPFLVELLGFSREEFLGKEVWELGFFKDFFANKDHFTELQQKGYVRYDDKPLETRAGQRVDVEFVSNVYQANGHKVIQCNIRDITERKRVEEVLRFKNVLLSTQQEASIDGILVVDEKSRILSHNRRFNEMWGLPANLVEDRIDEPVLQFVSAQMANPRSFLQRVQYLYEHRHETSRDELILTNGRVFDRYSAPMFGPEERYYGRIWYFRDITERKRAEESQARLVMAVEQGNDSVVITDSNGTILYVNPAFERITGYSKREALGQNSRLLKSGKQDAAFYRQMWDTLTRNEVWHGRIINKKKNSTLYEEDATISPVCDTAGKIINYVSVTRDVTKEVALEGQFRQAQKMEAVGQLAGGVAHDFNNLLMAIMGYSDITLKALSANDPSRKHLEQIQVAGKRAAALTRQLLAFSRKQVLQPRVLDLNDLIVNVSKMLDRLIGEDILVTTTLDPTLCRVKADPGQIEQIIMNLALNARDAMPEGGALIIQTAETELDEAYARQHDEVIPGRYVLLTVSDTGRGMTDEVKSHLFEPFFTTKDLGKGTGLGLSTVYGIVKQSDGHITVESEVGHGTTFRVYLPRVEEAAGVALLTEAPVECPRGTETILLVEDDEQVRNLALMGLEECGYTVCVAGNGPDAIQLAEQHEGKIQLLMTDMIMPEMSGRVLAPLLVSLNPGIKVLYMSGYTDAAVVRQDLLAAGSFFLQKPFSMEVLARTVRQVLDGGGREERQKAERWKLKSEVGGRWSGR